MCANGSRTYEEGDPRGNTDVASHLLGFSVPVATVCPQHQGRWVCFEKSVPQARTAKGLMLLPASQAACGVSVTTAVPEGHGNAVLTLQVTERTSEFPPDSTAYHRTINTEL